MKRPIVIVHRAFDKASLEDVKNSLQKLKSLGVDGVEIDVQVNEKYEPILVHDYLFDKTSDYPRLSDVISAVGNDLRLEIEIKGYETKLVNSILKQVHDSKIRNFEITSGEPPVINLVTKLLPMFERGLMIRDSAFESWMTTAHKNRLIIGYINLTGANVIHLDLKNYNYDLVRALKHIKVKTHTLLNGNKKENVRLIYELDIDICSITNIKDLKLILSYK